MENAEPFFRFNLSDISVTSGDKWYGRFKNADKKNSEEVVNELLGPAEPWIEMKTSPKTGIPYLAQIAKDPGSFGDIKNRRRQIAILQIGKLESQRQNKQPRQTGDKKMTGAE